jgi:hypothetical protein
MMRADGKDIQGITGMGEIVESSGKEARMMKQEESLTSRRANSVIRRTRCYGRPAWADVILRIIGKPVTCTTMFIIFYAFISLIFIALYRNQARNDEENL